MSETFSKDLLLKAKDIKALVFDVDGVLSDGKLYYGNDGELFKAFSSRDGMGLAMLRDCKFPMGIISGRLSEMVRNRATELGIETCLMRRMDKKDAFAELAEQWSLEFSQIAAIGDDIVDIPMIRRAGLGV